MSPSAVLCVRLCSGGKIYNLCKLELTSIIILPAQNGGMGSSLARKGSRLGVLIKRPFSYACALFSLVFTFSVSLNFVTICTGLYVS